MCVWALALHYHIDNSLNVFKNEQLSTIAGIWCLCWDITNGFLYDIGVLGSS